MLWKVCILNHCARTLLNITCNIYDETVVKCNGFGTVNYSVRAFIRIFYSRAVEKKNA